jgi:hypothetical protein
MAIEYADPMGPASVLLNSRIGFKQRVSEINDLSGSRGSLNLEWRAAAPQFPDCI